MSYKEYLLGELSSNALSDDRSSIEWDNGDRLRWLGNAIIGRGAEFSREGVRSRAKELRETNVNQDLAGKRREITDMLSGTGVNVGNLTLGGNRTEKDLAAEMQALDRTGKFAQEYRAIDGASASDIVAGATPSSIIELAQGLKKRNKETAENKIETKEENLWKRTTGRQDSLTERANNREDRLTERANIREDRRDARQELTRAQDRKDTLELRRDNMNLEYARMSQADKYKSQDRKDKAVMMLLQGLGNLGAGFTI